MADMVTLFDAIVVIVVFLSMIIGLIRGFVKETLSLLVWGGAAVLSVTLMPYCQPITAKYIENPMIVTAVTGGLLFVLLVVVLGFIVSFISLSVKRSAFRSADRSLGSLFGIARGWLLACLVVFFINASRVDGVQQHVKGASAPYIQSSIATLTKWAESLLTDGELKSAFQSFLDKQQDAKKPYRPKSDDGSNSLDKAGLNSLLEQMG
jgi:uncharacterized membrane protein required for colicin V production